MHHVRTSLRRLWLAGFLLIAFLTVQFAAAAYACAGSRYALEHANDMAGMTESCPDMASKSATPDTHDGLCLEHCQAGTKTADHTAPQIPAFLPVLVGLIEPTPAPALASRARTAGQAIPGTPPPIPILHCCFRT